MRSTAPAPALSPATTQILVKLEDGLNELKVSSIPDMSDRANSASKELERLYKEVVETNRRVTSLDRYATADEANDLIARFK